MKSDLILLDVDILANLAVVILAIEEKHGRQFQPYFRYEPK